MNFKTGEAIAVIRFAGPEWSAYPWPQPFGRPLARSRSPFLLQIRCACSNRGNAERFWGFVHLTED
jgi:hypothetical protein